MQGGLRKTAEALVVRSRVVLRCAEDKGNTDIAHWLEIAGEMVGKWRQRSLDQQLEGLLHVPKPGALRRIGGRGLGRVLQKTMDEIPRGATHWSVSSMPKASGISQTTSHRIWHAFSLQAHRSKAFKLSKGPLFIEKVHGIVGLYLALPGRARLCCCAWTRRGRSQPRQR